MSNETSTQVLALEIAKQRKLGVGQLETKILLDELGGEVAQQPKPAATPQTWLARVREKFAKSQGMNPALGGSPAVMANPDAVATASARNAAKRTEEK